MNKLILTAAATAVAGLIAGPAWAQGTPSAKATFTYAAINVVEEAHVACDTYEDPPVPADCELDLDDAAMGSHQVLYGTIKMPKHKELLIDVSLECGNFLDTQVKSKGGDKNSATAEATVRVLVLVNDGVNGWQPAVPSGNEGRDLDGDGIADQFTGINDGVVFCHRYQELEAKFQGIFTTDEQQAGFIGNEDGEFYLDEGECQAGADGEQICTAVTLVGTCLYQVDGTGKIFADLDCFEPEEIRLITASMTANSFNFMYPNTSESGVHQIAVIAYLDAGAGLSGDTPSGESRARAMIGLGSMSVQTVRMVKGPIAVSAPVDCDQNPEDCADLD